MLAIIEFLLLIILLYVIGKWIYVRTIAFWNAVIEGFKEGYNRWTKRR